MNKDSARILIIDESPFYPWFVQTILEAHGYSVLVAQDCERAFELITSEELDLVILETLLERLAGLEACRRILDCSSLPIIILTAREDQTDKIKGLLLGADDYITKPFYVDELVARVRAVLRRIEFSRQPQVWPAEEPNELLPKLAIS